MISCIDYVIFLVYLETLPKGFIKDLNVRIKIN